MSPDSEISPALKLVTAGSDTDTTLRRENGTLRDADILILSSEPDVVAEAEALAKTASMGELSVSAFGFEKRKYYETSLRRAGAVALHYYTSTREQDENGTVYHRMYPFEAAIPNNALAGWQMELPQDLGVISIIDPRYHLMSYAVRSVGGLRPKDSTKYHQAKSQVDAAFADIAIGELADMEALQAQLLAVQNLTFTNAVRTHGFFGIKSHILHIAENQTAIVDAFQKLRLDEWLLKRFVR
jgi:hypothetical protein